MTGVEILAVSEVVTDYAFDWDVYFIVMAVITVVFTLLSGLMNDFYLEDIVVGFITGVIFGAIIGCLPASTMTPSEYETQYKVIISDEVPMNDFLERYEILDQEGKIYTVRERSCDN
jgi:hypothetical protein